jgi:hypothetical protein
LTFKDKLGPIGTIRHLSSFRLHLHSLKQRYQFQLCSLPFIFTFDFTISSTIHQNGHFITFHLSKWLVRRHSPSERFNPNGLRRESLSTRSNHDQEQTRRRCHQLVCFPCPDRLSRPLFLNYQIYFFAVFRILEHADDPDIDDPVPSEGLKVPESKRSNHMAGFDLDALEDSAQRFATKRKKK